MKDICIFPVLDCLTYGRIYKILDEMSLKYKILDDNLCIGRFYDIGKW